MPGWERTNARALRDQDGACGVESSSLGRNPDPGNVVSWVTCRKRSAIACSFNLVMQFLCSIVFQGSDEGRALTILTWISAGKTLWQNWAPTQEGKLGGATIKTDTSRGGTYRGLCSSHQTREWVHAKSLVVSAGGQDGCRRWPRRGRGARHRKNRAPRQRLSGGTRTPRSQAWAGLANGR